MKILKISGRGSVTDELSFHLKAALLLSLSHVLRLRTFPDFEQNGLSEDETSLEKTFKGKSSVMNIKYSMRNMDLQKGVSNE